MTDHTNLILNADGSVYHLGLQPEEIAPIIFLVGDPDRVPSVSKHFSEIYIRKQRREICTHTGLYHGKRVTCISTGMGTDNIDIVLNELDALANIDLKSGSPKEHITPLQIIRLGTSGSLQNEIPVGSILASQTAVGLDALGVYYYHPNLPIADAMYDHLAANKLPILPYAVEASNELIYKLPSDIIKGTTATCAGFYAPQGRRLRAPETYMQQYIIPVLQNFLYNGTKITNLEMETSGIYLVSQALGHQALSLNAILANRVTGEFAQNPNEAVERMIEMALNLYV